MLLLSAYKALADETRLRIVAALARGPLNVGELTEITGLSQPTVSHHLKTLQSAAIVDVHRNGTWAFYSLALEQDGAVAKIVKDLLDLLEHGGEGVSTPLLLRDKQKLEETIRNRREQSHRYFEKVAQDWETFREEVSGAESYLDLMVSLIPKSGTLLELGCGTGPLLARLPKRSGATIAVDSSNAMLEYARSNLKRSPNKVDLRLGFLEHLPIGDDSVDIAVSNMVIHHIASPLEVLRDTHRVLKPGGTLQLIDLSKHDKEFKREQFAHLWLGFDKKELRAWCRQAKFENVEITSLGEGGEAFLLSATKG